MESKQYYCKACNNPISVSSGKYRTGLCKSCSHIGLQRPLHSIRMTGNNNPNYQDGRSLKKYYCECGKEIPWRQALYRKPFCVKCCNKGLRNPNWKGGLSFDDYALEWTEGFKQQIRDRDNNTCQICDIIKQPCGHKLSVHHIDYNKENLNPENLITLCKVCHLKTNFNRKFWRIYFANKIAI